MNSRDSFPRRKFKNQAPKSCSASPILSQTTINFELDAKTAEEIDVEKCNFRKFGSSVTLTLDRVEVTPLHICGRSLPTYQIRSKSEKNFFVDVRTDGRTVCVCVPEFQSTRSLPGDDLKMNLSTVKWAQ